MADRIIKLSDEHIEVIQNALSLASRHYLKTHRTLIEDSSAKDEQAAEYWMEKSKKLLQLSDSLANGSLDV